MVNKGSDLLLSSLTKFYQDKNELVICLDKITKGEFEISLRVIDWFVTHYSKTNNIIYWIDEKNDTIYEDMNNNIKPEFKKINLYLDYRSQLKSYTKGYFDPFRRHERISFVIKDKPFTVIETTIGQLNFFRWIFQNKVLTYLLKYKNQVEKSMNIEQKTRKSAKEKGDKKVRESKLINKTFIQNNCFLKFD
jgi:hypothetical protein